MLFSIQLGFLAVFATGGLAAPAGKSDTSMSSLSLELECLGEDSRELVVEPRIEVLAS